MRLPVGAHGDQRTATSPLPSVAARTCSCGAGTAGPLRRSSQTSFHTPTAAAGGDQPGVRPSRVVRNQRSCWCSTIGARQRGRGRRCANRLSSAWKCNNSVCEPGGTSRSCATNMLSLCSSGSPSSHTSATPARPSKPSHAVLPGSASPALKLTRYHQSSASKRLAGPSRLQCSAARNTAATVVGAGITIQHSGARRSTSAGVLHCPGDAGHKAQPLTKHSRPRGACPRRPVCVIAWF